METVVTIDPPDAKDFDDAVSVSLDPNTRHWILTVHIADVGAFAKHGALDSEARRRATSVYLPQKVIPMFPEVISNGLASLQEGKLRYVKSVRIEYTPHLQKGHVRFQCRDQEPQTLHVRRGAIHSRVDGIPRSSGRG